MKCVYQIYGLYCFSFGQGIAGRQTHIYASNKEPTTDCQYHVDLIYYLREKFDNKILVRARVSKVSKVLISPVGNRYGLCSVVLIYAKKLTYIL